ncbi:MAG: PorT family protein [Paludibacteraceae bacterium]|nr:PorT family protein [Paludibacteraceae bacterium]
MKRTVLLIFALLLVSVLSWAQPRLRQPEMYVGVHGGVTFNMVMFTPDVIGATNIIDRTLLSGNGGLVFRYAGHKCCAVQVELNYMQRGWRENTEDVPDASIHYQRRLDYIEVPFMAHIFFGKKMVRGFVNLGPQIGYCIHESQSGTMHPAKQEQYAAIDNKFDWGITGGLGMLLRTRKAGVFQIEARFGYSLGDYFHSNKTDYFSTSNPLNLNANIGYLWEIKPRPRKSVQSISQSTM